MSRALPSLLAALALGACTSAGRPPPPAPVHVGGQALWRIVHDRCAPAARERRSPSPCALVSLAGGEARGFAILKDRVGVAQHLLIPTARVTGIEDTALLRRDAPDYFAAAWTARTFVASRLGSGPAPVLSVAVNSAYGRSQDQLHLHIDCLARDVAATLRDEPPAPDGGWPRRTARLRGHRYFVRRTSAAELAAADPFHLLAREMPGARADMGAWTIALVGGEGSPGAPAFWLLADRADPAAGDRASSEELQDHACR